MLLCSFVHVARSSHLKMYRFYGMKHLAIINKCNEYFSALLQCPCFRFHNMNRKQH